MSIKPGLEFRWKQNQVLKPVVTEQGLLTRLTIPFIITPIKTKLVQKTD